MKSIVTYVYTMGVGGGIESAICDIKKDIVTAEDARLLETDIAEKSGYDKIIVLCCAPLHKEKHKKEHIEVASLIGIPALLEQCAEECAELSKVCLKYARKERNENFTPADWDTIRDNLVEEICDVRICIDEIMKSDALTSVPPEYFDKITDSKRKRWVSRIADNNLKAKQILANLAGMSIDDPVDLITDKLIFNRGTSDGKG